MRVSNKQRRYVIKPLRWNEEKRRAWLEDVMRVIIDMYIEQEQLQEELPIFESRKKS